MFHQKKELAQKVASQAVEQMMGLNIYPNPLNYTIWYNYFSNEYPDLKKELDEVLSKKVEISNDFLKNIYKKYFSYDDEIKVCTSATSKAGSILDELKDMLKETLDETSEYDKTLSDSLSNFDTINTPQDLKKTIHLILESTKTIQEHNANLHASIEESQHEINQLWKNVDLLKEQTMTDSLTGLSNRKFFDSTLLDLTSAEMSLSLILVDIDHFKKFNDNYGHLMGDQVLKLVSNTLIKETKNGGFPGRFGGEEFSIILPNTTTKEAQVIANNLRLAIASKKLQNKKTGKGLGKITISAGVSQYKSGESISELIERTDNALYAAKNGGRNRVACG
jgi:diguanylate cyclase